MGNVSVLSHFGIMLIKHNGGALFGEGSLPIWPLVSTKRHEAAFVLPKVSFI